MLFNHSPNEYSIELKEKRRMCMRKLASIQRIHAISNIENSDNLAVASVLGYKSVIRRDEFKVGELCVYIEYDSILPKTAEFEAFEKNNYRLRTERRRGQLSQGLCWVTSILDPAIPITEGLDVTDALGITKYEVEFPANMVGKSKGFFPKIVSQTSQDRVQSFPQLIEEFKGKRVAYLVKIEGFSSSFINDNGELHVCSHTHSMLDEKDSVYWKMARKYRLLEILEEVGHYSIQGEIAGEGIFGNPMGLVGLDLFIFAIFNNDTKAYLSLVEMERFCLKHGLKMVPVAQRDVLFDFTVDELIEEAKGFYEPSGHPQEGIVVIPMVPTNSEILCGNLTMKVINNDYLTAGGKKKKSRSA
jgi:RNA ligase (TIGR02306 family)